MKATIVYIVDPDTYEVLMAEKVRGVGKGYYLGYGGKLKPGETLEECAYRETLKESGYVIHIPLARLERAALIRFYNGNPLNPETDGASFEVLCYRAIMTKAEVGIPRNTDEMQHARWFPIDSIPFGTSLMKPGDELFVP